MAEGLVQWLSDPATLIGLGTVAALAAYYLFTRPRPLKSRIPLDRQSVELPGDERIHVSQFTVGGKLMETYFDDVTTLYEGFLRGMKVSDDGPCLGEREGPKGEGPYKFISYSEVLKRAHELGAGLAKLGIPPGQKSFVGIYSRNCTNWVVTALSCDAYSRVVVPLYDTLGPKAVAYAVNQAEVQLVVCHPSNLPTLTTDLGACRSLCQIVTWGSIPEDVAQRAEEHRVKLTTIEKVMQLGRDHPLDPQPASPEDVSTICYTSGTTGNPKGAMLTHSGFTAVCAATQKALGEVYAMNKDDVHLSFLPLAHSMERTIQLVQREYHAFCLCATQAFVFLNGSKIGFFRGDIKLLLDDIKELKPTLFAVVPRLLNRIYDKVMLGAKASVVKGMLLNIALYFKGKEVDSGIIRRDSFWDRLVFSKIQALLGGRVRYLVTGSAPIPKEVLRFMRISLGCQVFEGYGQTEAHAASCLTIPGETSAGHVGPPLPCVMIKLVDVPEMNYFSANNEGEICFKGPSVFHGYLKNEEKTREALDEQGWLHSGDIGKWLPQGVLKIIDRKKQIFKTQQGEYIAPEKIENTYGRSMFVAQAFLYGNSYKPCVLAVIVPDEEYLQMWAGKQGLKGDMEELCANKTVKETILSDITECGKKEGLLSFEQAKAIYLCPELFTIDNELLTPTHKLVRRNLEKRFMAEFDKMYAELPK